MTPEQMRALADTLDRCADNDRDAVRVPLLHESAAALRAAADQLEAVPAQRDAFLDSPMLDGMWVAGWHAAIDHVTYILTADTAPQEDRDE